ncbi:MAG TPA: hypothetical protein VGQ09_23435 [Chitinophagaceae bacterium]|jgi:hypothetical protein|nr:hypothetical protein [Chitinophagaceae bacterium]
MPGLLVYQYIIIIAAIIGMVRFQCLHPYYIKWLVLLLILTIIAELFPAFKIIRFRGSNHWWFNIFTVIEFLAYSYIFSRAITNPKTITIIRWSIPGYFVIAIANIFFIQGFHKFHTISYRIGAIMIVVWCYLYFRQLLQSEQEIVLFKNPMFWISTGLLFFYLGFFVYMSAFDLIVYKKIGYNKELWRGISYSLNTLLYSCFLIALLCPPKKAIS